MKIATLGAGAMTEAFVPLWVAAGHVVVVPPATDDREAADVVGELVRPGANDGLGRALVAPPDADATSVTGRFYDGEHKARANPQTYDEHTRQTLCAFSLQLIAPYVAQRSQG